MSNIKLEKVTKIFPSDVKAVKDFSIEVNEGEMLVLTGPSNCGKSTLLRLIAGLEDATSGEIIINDKLANYIDPIERNIALVYQNLTMYPDMTVWENLEFGMKFSSTQKRHIKEDIARIAGRFGITDILDKYPKDLDLMQRQRVSFAKAAIKEPTIYLVDRIESDCDEQTKIALYRDIKNMWPESKPTIIMAIDGNIIIENLEGRIAVMRKGSLEQAGTYQDLYNNPVNKFVAGFMGRGRTSFILAKVVEENNEVYLKIGKNSLKLREDKIKNIKSGGYIGKEIIIGLRPEDAKIMEYTEAENCLIAKIETVETNKGEDLLGMAIDGTYFYMKATEAFHRKKGEEMSVLVDVGRILMFDKETERII